MEDVVRALVEQNAQLTNALIEMAKALADLRKESEPVYVPVSHERQFPLYMPESEEDARALHEAGVIDKDQLQEVLKEVEFFNTEITVPS